MAHLFATPFYHKLCFWQGEYKDYIEDDEEVKTMVDDITSVVQQNAQECKVSARAICKWFALPVMSCVNLLLNKVVVSQAQRRQFWSSMYILGPAGL